MKLATAALLLACMPFVASAEDAPSDAPVPWGEFAGWRVFMDPSVGNACYVAHIYNAGVFIRLGRFHNETGSGIYLSFNNPKWKSLEDEKEYPVSVQFGNHELWDAKASALVKDNDVTRALTISTGDESFLEEFKTSDTTKLFYEGKEIANLSLDGAPKAVSEMNACQKKTDEVLNKLKSKAEDIDPFAKDPSVKASDDPFKL